MSRNICRILFFCLCLFCGIAVYGQDGAYGSFSPYSIYGIGNISKEGTAFNKSMGGVGIATRNRRFINILNPASLTARDSLSFMADFGLSEGNTVYRQNLDGARLISANNTFNIYDFVISFPIYRSSAFMVGITPFSDLGYDFSSDVTDGSIIGNTGNITYSNYGTGSIYQLFAGGAVTFWRRLSLGAQLIYYFGSLDKKYDMTYYDASYRSVNNGYNMRLRGLTGKFGVQYEQPLGNNLSLTLGATYRLRTNVKGQLTDYSYAVTSETVDTLRNNVNNLTRNDGIKFGDELGIGVALRGGEDWSVEVNYMMSDWRHSGFEDKGGLAAQGTSVFTSTVSHSVRAGFEIVPNRNDIRYYLRRCAYRAGAYYDTSYYLFDGNVVNSFGITLGVTLPVFRWYNGITLGVDLGQRGSLRNNMVRERYVSFAIGFNIHDLWFQKPRYN